MLFSDLTFLYVFLPFLFVLYYPFKNLKWRNTVLVLFSLVFYGCGEPKYLLLMLSCVLVNWVFGILIAGNIRRGDERGKKASLIFAVICNLGMLVFFKYLTLFNQIFDYIPGFSFRLPSIALPLGISFFTFQAMSYTIDVYREKTECQRSYFSLLLYVSLFPQLIAGPIVRYSDVAAELKGRTLTVSKINDGVFRFVLGLSKKVVIANACGLCADNLLTQSLDKTTALSSWIGILFYALHIYFDFSGYSDMAIGLGKMLGFDFLENFNYPYVSKSATEFWRRWHISLGSFFRDYLYIPLGGNRKYWVRNVLVVWLLTGLWHGASLNFILWGLYYGILLIFEKLLWRPLLSKLPKAADAVISYIYMIFVTLFGWTLFYYTEGLIPRIKALFGVGVGGASGYELSVLQSNIWLLLAAVVLSTPLCSFLIKKLLSRMKEESAYALERTLKTVFIFGGGFLSTILLVGDTYNPFIYFRF